MQSIDVLGTPLTVITYQGLTEQCQELAHTKRSWAIDLTNTQIVTMRRHEPKFRELTSHFDFFVPDGMPLIWVLNSRGAQLADRVYGPKFMRHCMVRSPAPRTHYLLGGSSDCLRALENNLIKERPDLKIIGRRHGYFESDKDNEIIREINALSPDFIWVGLGTPKQQDWIHRHKAQIDRGVIFAVGFAFDVNAGTKKDAPAWMQCSGLTWVFRVVSEPRRLAARYLRYNTLFLFYLVKDAWFSRRSSAV